jgi:hypothetical protein
MFCFMVNKNLKKSVELSLFFSVSLFSLMLIQEGRAKFVLSSVILAICCYFYYRYRLKKFVSMVRSGKIRYGIFYIWLSFFCLSYA